MHCPAVWAWMAVLLQYWQDHMTRHLYGGRFQQTSDLTATLIWDINSWLPHKLRFGWGYVAMHATLWLDLRNLFVDEHVEEWEAQKSRTCTLNDLEWDTEVVYWGCTIKRQEDKALTDSKEVATKELPPEWQEAHARRQASAMPTKADVTSTCLSTALYPDWILKRTTKPTGCNMSRSYRTPRDGAHEDLTLEEELDVGSVFDPLQLASQSSLSDHKRSSMPDTTQGAEGPKTPQHYSETPAYILPLNLVRAGILPKMSPITHRENTLLNLAPGSPVSHTVPPGLGRGQRKSEHSSCSSSPMSLGSPAVTSSLALALKVRARPPMPLVFGGREEPSGNSNEEEEEMDAAEADVEQKED